MRNKIFLHLILMILFLKGNLIVGQVIISQDFEGPLTGGWMSNGTILGSQNSINAYAGSGMISLGQQKNLTGPVFTLPAGTKNLSFWWNVAVPSAFATLNAVLAQNSSTVANLGSWTFATAWQQTIINIPAGYTGNNYTITFSVQSSSSSTTFYLDEINLSAGSFPTSVNESEEDDAHITIVQDVFDRNKIKILGTKEAEDFDLYIFTIDGKEVFLRKAINISGSPTSEIELPEISKGLYILKLSNGKKFYTQKLFI